MSCLVNAFSKQLLTMANKNEWPFGRNPSCLPTTYQEPTLCVLRRNKSLAKVPVIHYVNFEPRVLPFVPWLLI